MKHFLFAASAVLLALAAPLAAQDAPEEATILLPPPARDRHTGLSLSEIEEREQQINAIIVFDRRVLIDGYNAGSLLDGRTVLVKDNIETRDFPTTAGSLALASNDTGRDAPLVARLRINGGLVMGKTNLSEWANFRSSDSSSGWSAVGGQTHNPHAIDRNPCGSSSGSAAAVAAELAWAAIGTETDGSISCPASVNGIVGFKPTVGLVSQDLIVPISASQDTAGPMARSVHDAALLLTAIAEPLHGRPVDFTRGLPDASLADVRIGVVRERCGNFAPLCAVYEAALRDLTAAGAVLVDVTVQPDDAMGEAEYSVLLYEFRVGIDAYLANSPADIPVRSLADLVAFNNSHSAEEMRWFGQDVFEAALASTDDAAYRHARATSFRLAGPEGIDRLLAEHQVAFLIAPTRGPAWNIDPLLGDHWRGGIGIGSMAAVAGYPHLTVPMGHVEGLPVGLSFIGAANSDHAILQAGAAYERARTAEIPSPSFTRWQPLAEGNELP